MIKLFQKTETEKYIIIKILFIKITFKKKQQKSDIDNIVWCIPIRKVRDSLRNYLSKLIEDNEFLKKDNEIIKFQNNCIIEELLKQKGKKEGLPEKELNINNLSDFGKNTMKLMKVITKFAFI